MPFSLTVSFMVGGIWVTVSAWLLGGAEHKSALWVANHVDMIEPRQQLCKARLGWVFPVGKFSVYCHTLLPEEFTLSMTPQRGQLKTLPLGSFLDSAPCISPLAEFNLYPFTVITLTVSKIVFSEFCWVLLVNYWTWGWLWGTPKLATDIRGEWSWVLFWNFTST